MTNETGSMSAGDRFSGIEATLLRIEMKLDHKVDRDELNVLRTRVELLEAGETPLGKAMIQQFADFQLRVNDLALHGSSQAQDALRELAVLTKSVAELETARIDQAARIDTNRATGEKSYRTVTLILGILTLLAITLSSVAAVIAIAHTAVHP